MRYLPNSGREEEMLKEVGLTLGKIFSDIPKEFKKDVNLPDALSEPDLKRRMKHVLGKNKQLVSFLGGGVWNHYIPAHVIQLASRSEFYTAYTPYQPEISQGMLQSLFEYQSMIAELTGLEAVNSSLYDWSTALGESALMCTRVTGRREFLVPDIISLERLAVLKTWAHGADITVKQVKHVDGTGQLDLEDLKQKLSENTAGVYVENPSYLGFFQEEVAQVSELAHDNNSLFVAGVDPISLGIIKAPAEYGADIAIGEAQCLGSPQNFGGPLLGLFAVKAEQNLMRKMPGRIIGLTEDADGKRGYVMTLQTREQHIRRDKATSNICSNEALCAVTSAIYLASLGKKGIIELGETVMRNANYVMKKIDELLDFKAPLFNSTHFKEFTVKTKKNMSKLIEHGSHPGLRQDKRGFPDTYLWCVTEQHTKEEVDKLLEVLQDV